MLTSLVNDVLVMNTASRHAKQYFVMKAKPYHALEWLGMTAIFLNNVKNFLGLTIDNHLCYGSRCPTTVSSNADVAAGISCSNASEL